jgi:hypothetical protein
VSVRGTIRRRELIQMLAGVSGICPIVARAQQARRINVTGFAVMEPTLGAKLLGILKQIAPRVTRVSVLMNPDNATHKYVLTSLGAAASGFAVSIESAARSFIPGSKTNSPGDFRRLKFYICRAV